MAAIEPMGHDDIEVLVRRLRLGIEASELHGSVCGYLAGGGRFGIGAVLGALEIEAGEALGPGDAAMLDHLAKQCAGELADDELAFAPDLPDDDRPLAERADAVAAWCRGFLGGFGLAGSGAHARLSAEAEEVLRDLGTIAASDFDLGDANEDEDALIEVQEFIRIGAMLLYADAHTGGTVH